MDVSLARWNLYIIDILSIPVQHVKDASLLRG